MSAASYRKRLGRDAAVARGELIEAREGQTIRLSRGRADLVISSGTIHHAKDRLRRFDNLEAAISRKLEIEQARRSRFNPARVIMLREALARLAVLMPFYRGRTLP